MNLNTVDPLLYRNRASETENKILNFQKGTEKETGKKTYSEGSFFSEISNEINKSINPEMRQKISSSKLNFNMSRSEVLSDIHMSPDKEKLYNASKEFESFFVEKMFIEMKKNVPKNKMFHGGYAEDIFDDMLLSERVRKVSDQSEFGLAEMMYQQLSVVYTG